MGAPILVVSHARSRIAPASLGLRSGGVFKCKPAHLRGLVADRICNRAAGQTQGLVWEHFDENWTPQLDFDNDNEALKIFRPWGFQPDPVWKSNFGRPTPSTRPRPRICICSMAWRFHTIDALSNLTHWLISTQAWPSSGMGPVFTYY